MYLNVINTRANNEKSFENVMACNGKPGISAITENPVYRPDGKLADTQISMDYTEIVYVVAIGDYICMQKYDYDTETTYITWYKVVDINSTEIIANPI